MPRGLGPHVEPHDGNAVPLERCAVEQALADGPVEDMAQPREQPIDADLALLSAGAQPGFRLRGLLECGRSERFHPTGDERPRPRPPPPRPARAGARCESPPPAACRCPMLFGAPKAFVERTPQLVSKTENIPHTEAQDYETEQVREEVIKSRAPPRSLLDVRVSASFQRPSRIAFTLKRQCCGRGTRVRL